MREPKIVTQEMLDYAYPGGWNMVDVVKSEMKIEAFGQGEVSEEAESKRIEPPTLNPSPQKGTA